MLREVLQSKIHKATVTDADLNYIGSITIDQDLLDRIDLWPGQKVTVVSNTSGHRLETYVISGPRKSGMICVNGAAAHLIKKGDEVIIFSYGFVDRPLDPKVILVDDKNNFLQYL
ncbi:MAG: aspartate 1-decarboxylase [Bacteriovoracaceae bacterium]|nr:aspartate 1-decarboxylase [Bacteriovoracaceae bacterium]